MNDGTQLEARIGALIAAYADRAPADVDPMAVARTVAVRRRAVVRPGAGYAPIGIAVALVLALLTMLAGALLAGRPFERDPADVFTDRDVVAPFVGLPPEWASSSDPETGELVLSFAARIKALGYEVHVAWLYKDGRLIWRRNLEGSAASQAEAFEGRPTLGVIEQRLTPDGVERLRADALAALDPPSLADESSAMIRERGGVVWGTVAVHDGTGLRAGRWSGSGFPMRIAAPATWLPDSDWADRQLRGYVPSSYLVCVQRPDLLPEAARARLPEPALMPTPMCAEGTPYVVPLADARAIAGALEAAGAPVLEDAPILAFGQAFVSFYGILPHGEPVSYGG